MPTKECDDNESKLKTNNTIYMKLKVNFTIEDYYSYIGNDPCYYSPKERVKQSIPGELVNHMYNMRFKILKAKTPWDKYYRIHCSVNMEESKFITLLKKWENWGHRPKNVTYKVIKGCNVH